MTLIVSPDHPLARRERVHVRDLGDQRFVELNLRDAFARRTAEAFKKNRTPLTVTMKVDTFEEMKKLVAMNLGIALAPLMCVRDELARGELITVQLDGLRCERTLWLVSRATEAHSFAALAFLQLACDFARPLTEHEQSGEPRGSATTKPAPVIRLGRTLPDVATRD
jgi:DNA-binding transcriptional LysR family regulator